MTTLEPFFLEVTLKATVVLTVAALLVLLLRRASAAYRHIVWVVAFGAVLALPILLALPAWQVRAPGLAWMHPAPASHTSVVVTGPFQDRGVSTSTSGERVVPPETTTEVLVDTPPSEAAAIPRGPIPWGTLAIALWALGAIVVLAMFLMGYLELRRRIRMAAPVEGEEWNALAIEAAERLGLRAPFALLRGEGFAVPIAVGFARPRVLLPAGSEAWSVELKRAVLLHELAHVQRHDCLTQAMAQIACALYWFHPGFWWAASQMRQERERACDDCVLRARTKPSEYAEHLLGVVRSLRPGGREAMAAVAFARPSSLEGRLLSVLDPIRDRRAVGRRAASFGAILAAALVVPLAILEPVQAYSVRFESKTKRTHERTDPESLRPSRVVAVPGSQGSLEQRTAWARSEAERAHERTYWIGWRMDMSPSLKGNVLNDTEGISLWQLGQNGLLTLEDVLEGRTQGTWNENGSDADEARSGHAAVLVRMSRGTIDRIRVQSVGLPADFANQPLYWIEPVADAETAGWLKAFATRSGDQDMRRQAMESLGFMKSSELVVPFLRATLEGKDSDEVRAGAAEGLGHHASRDVVKLLSEHARGDRSTDVRRACVDAMGQAQTPEALEALLSIAHAGGSEAGARHAAYEALAQKVSERAVEESGGRSKGWTKEEADGDEEEGEVDLPDEPSVPMPEGEEEVQRQAIEALGRYPAEKSLPRLRRIAESSPNADLRSQALESIGRLGTPEAVEFVERMAWKNSMEDARRAAVEALGKQVPEEKALEKLATIARTHPSKETRRNAVEMLGRFDSPKAKAVLTEVVAKGNSEDVQRQAVESLGRRDEPGIEGQLLEIARTHRSVDVRRQAVESLGRRDGKEIARELVEIAKSDGPEDVQRQAVESLGRLDQDVMPELEKIARSHPSSTVRHQAVESMMKRDPDNALKVIEDILREPKGRTGT